MRSPHFAYQKLLHPSGKAVVLIDIIAAITSALSFRKRDNAILAATKKLNISGAALSMFTLQTAMIHSFDGTVSSYSRTMNTITGTAVMLIMLWNALSMSIRAQKRIKQEELQ